MSRHRAFCQESCCWEQFWLLALAAPAAVQRAASQAFCFLVLSGHRTGAEHSLVLTCQRATPVSIPECNSFFLLSVHHFEQLGRRSIVLCARLAASAVVCTGLEDCWFDVGFQWRPYKHWIGSVACLHTTPTASSRLCLSHAGCAAGHVTWC